MKRKLSVEECVVKEIVGLGGAACAEDIFSRVDATDPQICKALIALCLDRTLEPPSRENDGMYKLLPQKALTEADLKAVTAHMEKELQERREESQRLNQTSSQKAYHELEYDHHDLCVKYYDALAVIRYLESKLVVRDAYSRKES